MKREYMQWGLQNPSCQRSQDYPPTVTIFGAGVAGLTAAHELIERGFNVNVVEPSKSPTEEYACQVGGVAANQLGRVKIEQRSGKAERFDGSTLLMQPVQRRFPITPKIQFDKDQVDNWKDITDEYGVSNCEKLRYVKQLLVYVWSEYQHDNKDQQPEVLQLHILGYTDSDGEPQENRDISKYWATLVLDEVKLETIVPMVAYIPDGRGAEAPLGNQVDQENRRRSNRVEFHLGEQPIPGEHGYRFFPNFYRHIFDTMRRTPVFDKAGDLTAETAYDQLVPTRNTLIAFNNGKGPNKVELRRFTTFTEIRKTIQFFKDEAKFTDKDLLRLQTHFLKYMTSCNERRTAEAENSSFWHYVHADIVKYSTAAARFLNGAPQALVAMSAKETDARTQYNALIQMLLQNPLDPFQPDMQLNGTTSEAWLNRWKDYLKRKGVEFFRGRLNKLILCDNELLPEIVGSADEVDLINGAPLQKEIVPENVGGPGNSDQKEIINKIDKSDFFIMAVPLDVASKLIWDACAQVTDKSKISGPFKQLMDFDIYTGRRDQHGIVISRRRNGSGRPGDNDPQRDISGVQFFLPQNYRIGDGYVYYPDSSWALSSISQLAFWRERINPIGNYIGQVSFDIGDWYTQYSGNEHATGPTAWNSTRQEIAENTWNQALAGLNKRYGAAILLPKYYHVDQGIKFKQENPLEGGQYTTTTAFRANARLLLTPISTESSYEIMFVETGIRVASSETNNKVARDALVHRIKESGAGYARGLPGDEGELESELLISPIKLGREAIVRIIGVSDKEYLLVLDGNEVRSTLPGANMLAVRDDLASKIPDRYVVSKIGETAFRLESRLPSTRQEINQFSLSAVNEDGAIEVLGIRMTLNTNRNIDVRNKGQAIVLDNVNPYIVNVPGQWRYRPGIARKTSQPHPEENEIQYWSPNDSLFSRWIPASTYMATYTRLTTMEAANESGRHAVNAILQKLVNSTDKKQVKSTDNLTYNGQGKLFGDFCDIWNPEDYEPQDLSTFKELDTALMREGLPHVFDIFRVIDIIEALPDDISVADALLQIRNAMERQYESSIAASSLIGLAVDSGIRAQIQVLHSLLSSVLR
jgi:hypothetical protein